MRLTPDQLAPFGVDAGLVHFVDTAFAGGDPQRVGVAVSGGGDSMALLHVAKCRADLAGTTLEAVTVDHGLRPEAAQEAELVAHFCDAQGIAHTTLHWDGASAQGNIAAAGRAARYRLMADWAKSRGIGGVLLGHTQDDVAETFLMRLSRKAGVDGLALMDVRFEKHGLRWARPFWQQTRADLRDYLRRHEIAWAEDPTNEDSRYLRPKARKALAALAPLGIDGKALTSVALSLASARDALAAYADQEAQRLVSLEGGDVVIALPDGPPPPYEIERRLWIAALRYIGGGAYAPREHALVELHHGLWNTGRHTLAGCFVTKTKHYIRFTRELRPVADLHCATDQTWDGRWALDGPHHTKLTIRALGGAIKDIPDWRDVGLPRRSLMGTPAVFEGDRLIAGPVAGLQNGWKARIVADFHSFLLSR